MFGGLEVGAAGGEHEQDKRAAVVSSAKSFGLLRARSGKMLGTPAALEASPNQ